MTAIILLVGLSNLAIGYALAVLFGFGPQVDDVWGEGGLAAAAPAESARAAVLAVDSAAVRHDAAPAADNSASDDLFRSMVGKPTADNAAAGKVGSGPPDAVAFVGAAILRMNASIDSILARTAETDIKFREQVDKYDLPAIESVYQELLKDCRAHLAEQSSARRQVQERLQAAPGLEALAAQIEETHERHAADMERLLGQLETMERNEPAQAAQWLLNETIQLLSRWHELRDFHQHSFLTAARQAQQLGRLLESQTTDSLTALRNRIGMEEVLEGWLTANRPAQQSLCAALLDIDRMGALNMEQGSQVGDRVLQHVAKRLRETLDAEFPVGRVAGQRFLVFTVGRGERNTVRTVQALRQAIAQFGFTHRGRQSRITASAAVTEIAPDDSAESLWRRLDAALAETKRQGGNRLVIHDGTGTTPAPALPDASEPQEVLV